MADKQPVVSVVMPAYNAEKYIVQAIQSVQQQTMVDWELIVIDDCSTDQTYDIAQGIAAEDFRITVIKNECNCGVAITRNNAIALSRGMYIAFLDSDDIWWPSKLEKQLHQMKTNNADIVYCSYEIIDSDGDNIKKNYVVPATVDYESLLKENVIQCSAMLIKADLVKKYLFNTEFYHEDYVLGLEMLRNGHRAVGCTEILLKWRYLENSRSFNKFSSAVNRWIIYREYCRLPIATSMFLFAHYVCAGIRKYFRNYRQK